MEKLSASRMQEMNPFLNRLAEEMELSDNLPRTLRILRAILLGVRNAIPPDDSDRLAEQLPTCIKLVYLEGAGRNPLIHKVYSMEEFIEEVYQLGGGDSGKTFKRKSEVEKYIYTTAKRIERQVLPAVWRHIIHCLPKPLRFYLEDYVLEGSSAIY